MADFREKSPRGAAGPTGAFVMPGSALPTLYTGPGGALVASYSKETQPPDGERVVSFTGPAWKITGPELKDVLKALENPPKAIDWTNALAACLSSVFFAWKTFEDSNGVLDGRNLTAFAIAIGVASVAAKRIADQLLKKQPLQELALGHVRSALGITDKPVRNWWQFWLWFK
jgi:hypothetical protein